MSIRSVKETLLTRPECLCVVMFLGLFPLISNIILFHPDERFYIDAGVAMVESGDYLTPRTPAGDVRLRKPVIPYWFTVAGYYSCGISVIGARLFFTLAGCLLVWLTWKTAVVAFESRTAGVIAAVIVMCHPAVLKSARGMPDMCLAVFTALSCYGFVSIIRKQRVTLLDLLACYGGGTLAVLSKGIPAAAFVVYGSAFLVLRQRRLVLSNWIRFSVAIVGAVLGSLSWFLWMWVKHGHELVDQFIGDQVGPDRFAAEGIAQITVQMIQICAMFVLSFSLWMLPNWKGLARTRSSVRNIVLQSDIQLLLSWCCIYILLASAVTFVSMRYLLPIVPFSAVCCGGILARVAPSDLSRSFRALFGLSLALVVLAAAFFAFAYWPNHPAIAGVVLVGSLLAIILSWYWSSSWDAVGRAVAVGCAVYCAVGLASVGAYPIFLPSLATQVAEELQDETDPRPLLLIDHYSSGKTYATQLRLAFGNRRKVVLVPPEQTDIKSSDFVGIVSTNSELAILAKENWTLRTLPAGYSRIAFADVVDAVLTGRMRDALSKKRIHCIFAARNEAPASGVVSRVAAFETDRF